jgi:hypothetical protein
MKGDIVLRRGTYIEMVIEEAGITRVVACFQFRKSRPQPIDIRSYRIEYEDEGQPKQQIANELEEAMTTFRILTEQHDQRTKDRLLCFQLSERVRRGLCIHCGSSENVIRALCVECRKLPRFQEVLESE